jgi:hypothetical protein
MDSQTEKIRKDVMEILGRHSISSDLLALELTLFITVKIRSATADGKLEALRAFTEFEKAKL